MLWASCYDICMSSLLHISYYTSFSWALALVFSGIIFLRVPPPCVCVCSVRTCARVCVFPLEKNNYKLYELSLWARLSGPSPWLHGCNRLITCLILVMSPRWQLFPGLWKQTFWSWPGPGLDDLSVVIAALGVFPSVCLTYFKRFFQKIGPSESSSPAKSCLLIALFPLMFSDVIY